MLARCASHGFSIVDIDERHEQEALRSELRRLARQWRVRIRTVARAGRVGGVVRLDEQPRNDDERTVIGRVNDALGETSTGRGLCPGPGGRRRLRRCSLTNHRAGQAEQTGPRLLGSFESSHSSARSVSPDPGGATEGDLATPRRSPIGRQVNASRIPASGDDPTLIERRGGACPASC